MKGLLVKDFLGVASYLKSYILVLALCTIPIFINMDFVFASGFASGICVFIGGMLCYTSFFNDSVSRWDAYCLTLPFMRKQIVREKYVFALLLVAVGAGIAAVVNLVFALATGGSLGPERWASLGVMGCAVVIFLSVAIPLIYRFGVEKSRIIVMVLFMVPFFVLLPLVSNYSGGSPGVLDAGVLAGLLAVAAVAALFLSYFLSCRIYQKKEV